MCIVIGTLLGRWGHSDKTDRLVTLVDGDSGVVFYVRVRCVLLGFDVYLLVFHRLLPPLLGQPHPSFNYPLLVPGSFHCSLTS